MNSLALRQDLTDTHLISAVHALVREAGELRDAMALDAEDHETSDDD